MELIKDVQGSEIAIKVIGRLNTATTPELSDALDDLDGVTKVSLDLEELDYLSSSALRVMLSVHKKMAKQGELVLYNVSDDVMEIFEMTGFADLLNFG